MKDKIMDVSDLVAELKLRAEALKALVNVFGDAFTTDRDPEKLAQAVRNRPEVYTHLWYLITDLVCSQAAAAGEIEDRLAEIKP